MTTASASRPSAFGPGALAYLERRMMATPIGDSIGADNRPELRIAYVQESPFRFRVTVNDRFFGSVYIDSSRAPSHGSRRFVDFGLAVIDPEGTSVQVETVFMTLDSATYKDDIAVLARYMEPGTR